MIKMDRLKMTKGYESRDLHEPLRYGNTMDLEEPLTKRVTIRIQPSVFEAFKKICKKQPLGPVPVNDMLRRIIVDRIKKAENGNPMTITD